MAQRVRASTVLAWGNQATNSGRLILAAKTAVAAAIAWYLAPFVPFADSEYSYYAPLGVLISMYPTVAGSARAAVQALIGLAIGIGLGLGGLALVSVGAPGVLSVAMVIAVGIMVGGIVALGAGRDWVAIAGLFVLLLGGSEADEFSLSYLLTVAFGVLVGVAMNLIVVPPLYLRQASDQLTMLRDAVSGSLQELAAVLAEEEIDTQRAAEATSELGPKLAAAGEEVREAEESSRGNPRGRRRQEDRRLNAQRLQALERTTGATQELGDLLTRAAEEESRMDAATREAFANAVRASGDLVAAPIGDSSAGERLAAASDALDAAMAALDRRAESAGAANFAHAYAYAAAVCVRRIVDASREFVERET